jgi:eukaryotic-like serine/threonine-protein kinase
MIGREISHYRILEELGRGGMGVVYKAQDFKLERLVALKFLPPDLTRDREAKQRFIHEAKAASALQHNNICVVYDIDETSDGQVFMCMEYLAGGTLKQKIERGPLKVEEAIDFGIQVALGLTKAHEHGIVHRDIKSANILVTEDGLVKIVDFGLAKLTGRTVLTKAGSTVGTIAHMSPEQTKGDSVDHRTDIWSLGVEIYEMVAGQMPFKGDYDNAVIYSIANIDPEPLTGLRTGVPMELERIVTKALRKKPEDRYQHINDMLVDLRVLRSDLPRMTTSSPAIGLSQPARRVSRWRQLTPWFVALVMALVALGIFWRPWSEPRFTNQRQVSFTVFSQEGDSLNGIAGSIASVAISRDGRKLVYGVLRDGISRLYFRALESLQARTIAGTEGARNPFFSPDGNWVGFFAGGYLKKVSLLSGAPQIICKAEYGAGGTWGGDNTIVFVKWVESNGLYEIKADGSGNERQIKVTVDTPFNWFGYPEFLPDAKTVIVTISRSQYENYIAIVSTETGKTRFLIEGSEYARYSPSGHIIYSRTGEGDLWAVPFSVSDLELSGSPFPVLDGVRQFALSETGTLVYTPGSGIQQNDTVALVNRKGEIKPLPIPAGAFHGLRFSPDGKRLVFGWHQTRVNLWIYELDRNVLRRFTDEQGNDWTPLWTPDSRHILFQSNRAGQGFRLFLKALDAEGPGAPLTETNHKQQPGCWTADGKALIFQEGVFPETLHDIMLLPLDGDRTPRPLLRTKYNERFPVLSPDGRWLAYGSDESGRWEVYVRHYPDLEDITRISIEGGVAPMWNPDGDELFYWDTNLQTLVFVSVRAGRALEIGKPKLFARGNFSFGNNSWYRSYDIAPDGKSLVMILKGTSGTSPRQFHVVLNWFEELKAREHGNEPSVGSQ